MKYDDPEFEETLKNIFEHPIVCGSHQNPESYLGVGQGGSNSVSIIGLHLRLSTETEEGWEIEWEHCDHQFGFVRIGLGSPDRCFKPEVSNESFNSGCVGDTGQSVYGFQK